MNSESWQRVKAICFEALERTPEERAAFLAAACQSDEPLRRAVSDFLSAGQTVATSAQESPAGLTTLLLPDQKLAVERWQRLEALFREAVRRSADERASFLAAACGDDDSLRRGVESLIAYEASERESLSARHNDAAGRSDTALSHAAAAPRDSSARPQAEQRVGPYKIIREIGHGGMGSVYLAVRDDEFKKRVAVKLIRRGMDTDDVLRRFRHERQILASLDHPHIAKLLDGGTTDDGLPYFVMEYVEGVPIDDYCDRHKLSTTERLKLFRAVCSAVHYAHQNLVVHRDLKPSNIIVTSDGGVKLLDFGIAKLLNPEMGGQTIDPTAPAMRLMTPDYASPEQVRGEAITTASDVYSLGVLLYELLSGHRPYRVRSRLPHDIVRVVCESEPERPSTAISRTVQVTSALGATMQLTPERVSEMRDGQPEKLRRRLAGDLDNIVLMALRKEPQRRYASVEQLSEDIRRHLAGLPVIARQDTFAYRAGKFVRRNRLAVCAAAAIAALLVAAVVVTLVQSARVARERDRAERERERAERVSAFLVDLFKVADPGESKGGTVTARELLDQGAERIARELKDQPEAQATLMNTMGRAYHSLGLYDRAAALLGGALKTRRERLGSGHADVAESLHDLGLLLHDRGDYDQAEPLLRESLELRRSLLGPRHPDVADSLNDLAVLLNSKRDYAAAEPLYREALGLRRTLLGYEHPDLAMNLNNLALLLQEKGDHDAAEPLQREALAMHRKLLGPGHPDLVPSLNNLALLLHRKRDYAGAEPLYREALELRRKLYGEEHPQVAFTTANLATLLSDKGDYAAAEPLFRRSLEMRRKLLPPGHLHVGHSLLGLGRLLLEKGEAAASEPLLREARAVFREKLPPGNWMTADAESTLGGSLAALRRYAEAEPLLAASYPVLRDARGASNIRTEQARARLLQLYEAWGKPEKAAPYRAASAR